MYVLFIINMWSLVFQTDIGILYNWAAHSPCNRSCDPDTGQVTADEGHVMTTKGQVHRF